MADSRGFNIDTDDVFASIDHLNDDLRANLIAAEEELLTQFLADAQARAPERTGEYKVDLGGNVISADTAIFASAWDTDKDASWLEYGAEIPPHEIFPNTAEALSFEDHGVHIFAKKVEAPGGHIKPEEILHTVLDNMTDDIIGALSHAIDAASDDF